MRDFKPGYAMPVESLEHMRWFYVYRYYDVDGELIYIGVTGDPYQRWLQHKRLRPWGHEIALVSLERYAYEDLALEHERIAIRSEGPKYNIRSTGRGDAQQSAAGRASGIARSNARSIASLPSTNETNETDSTLEALPLTSRYGALVTRAKGSSE